MRNHDRERGFAGGDRLWTWVVALGAGDLRILDRLAVGLVAVGPLSRATGCHLGGVAGRGRAALSLGFPVDGRRGYSPARGRRVSGVSHRHYRARRGALLVGDGIGVPVLPIVRYYQATAHRPRRGHRRWSGNRSGRRGGRSLCLDRARLGQRFTASVSGHGYSLKTPYFPRLDNGFLVIPRSKSFRVRE